MAAARIFQAKGWEVTGWTRSARESDAGFPLRAVDLTDRRSVESASFPADVVVHCASSGGGEAQDYRAIYRDGATNLAAAFPGARLLYTSSTSVYAQQSGEWVTEESAAEPNGEKGKILREAEDVVLAQGGIVLRLAGIYGPGRSFLLRLVRERKPVALTNDRWVNQVHRDDIAAAIFRIATAAKIPAAPIMNVVDNAPALRSEILQWLAARLQTSLQIVAEKDASPRRRGDSNKRVNNARLRALGWAPRFPDFRTAFEQSILLAE